MTRHLFQPHISLFVWIYGVLNFLVTVAFCFMSLVINACEPAAGGFGFGISGGTFVLFIVMCKILTDISHLESV